jgi:hypothetical protein
MAIFRVPVNIVFPGAGSPGANIWHIRTSSLVPATELSQANSLIGYIRTFYNSLTALQPTGVVYTLGTVTDVTSSREIVPTMTAVSAIGTGSIAQALAVVVTWRTSIAARRGRGRTFVGPLATAVQQSDGTITNANLTTIQNSAAALVSSSLLDGNGAIGVYGYDAAKPAGKANPRNPADAKIFRDFTGSQVRDLFGVLRSRRD